MDLWKRVPIAQATFWLAILTHSNVWVINCQPYASDICSDKPTNRHLWGNCFFASLRGNQIEITDVRTPTDQALSYVYPGLGQRPAHACSSAKAIIAFLSNNEKAIIFKEPFNRLTEKTIVEMQALELEPEDVRKQGFALCDGEIEPGVASIAVPIHLNNIGVRFSLGIVGPSARISKKLDDGACKNLVQESANASQIILEQRLLELA